MTNDQVYGVDTVLQDLRSRIPVLIKAALLDDEISRVVTSPRVQETLEEEANRNAEPILQSTNAEIAEVRKAHEALAAHEGRALGGPDPNSVSRALLQASASLTAAVAYIVAVVFLGQRDSGSDWLLLVLAGILIFNLTWAALSRVVAVSRPDLYSTSEIYWAGLRFLLSLFPAAIAAAYIYLNHRWIFKNSTTGFAVTCVLGLIVLGIQVSSSLWIPGTRYFYVGSQARRTIMKQAGASAFWFSTIGVLQEAIPAMGVSFVYLLRYESAARHMRRGGKPLTGRNPIYAWHGEQQRLENSLETSMQAWDQALIRKGIIPFLRNRINEITTPSFSLELKIYDSAGLSQMSAQEYIVPTPAFSRQQKTVDPLDGGIVGIAGPRGAGKTTILQAYKAGRFLKVGEQQIVVFETVPVAYDARDFILHLYFQVCANVANFIDQHVLGVVSKRKREGTRHYWAVVLLPVLAMIWVPVFWYATTIDHDPHFKLPLWLTSSGWLIGLAVSLSAILAIYYWKARRDRPYEPRDQEATDLRSLQELARRRMMDIKFQQSHTYGWAGKLGMPLPYTAEFSKSHELELASKSRTYPEIVADFQCFLAATVTIVKSVPNLARVPLVIILDELDKIASIDSVREFMNEAKGFLRMQSPGVLCLISVSEDALTSFEERGLPARDALDSTFDTVIDVGYLSLTDSIQLLNRRVIGMSLPFVCLCHCMAGGLPRELVRAAREVTETNSSTIGKICREIVLSDLHGKLRSWRTAIVGSGSGSSQKAELIGYLNEAILGSVSAAELLHLLENHPVLKNDADGKMGLGEVQLQIMAYLYFAATLLEVFTEMLTEEKVQQASIPTSPGSFDVLASTRSTILGESSCCMADSECV